MLPCVQGQLKWHVLSFCCSDVTTFLLNSVCSGSVQTVLLLPYRHYLIAIMHSEMMHTYSALYTMMHNSIVIGFIVIGLSMRPIHIVQMDIPCLWCTKAFPGE
jgi:TctA family transporter